MMGVKKEAPCYSLAREGCTTKGMWSSSGSTEEPQMGVRTDWTKHAVRGTVAVWDR